MFVYLSDLGTVMFAALAGVLLHLLKKTQTINKDSCLERNY